MNQGIAPTNGLQLFGELLNLNDETRCINGGQRRPRIEGGDFVDDIGQHGFRERERLIQVRTYWSRSYQF
ncbi:unnamed protein product [Linum trigynum]|uniref:Uncharacterized protein n=1 Tax=Linum trigynum TaxID=586398 RepID=A0AAV2EF07_9ROSI